MPFKFNPFTHKLDIIDSRGGGGNVNTVTGSGNIVASPTTGNVVVSSTGIQVIRGPTVDFTVLNNTITLFTPSADFIITTILLYGVSVTGISSGGNANIGFTAPNYSDILNTYSFGTNGTGQYQYVDISGPNAPIVPASIPLKIKITFPDSATTCMLRCVIKGYY